MRTDKEIRKSVLNELKQNSLVDPSEIDVHVKNGIVTLNRKSEQFYIKSYRRIYKKIKQVGNDKRGRYSF